MSTTGISEGRWEGEEGEGREGALNPEAVQVECLAYYSREGLSPAFERCRLLLLAQPEWTTHCSMTYWRVKTVKGLILLIIQYVAHFHAAREVMFAKPLALGKRL